ncbi:LXG domain-containing protein [Bacillus circulans]|uniref:LXG domain-containing protein n=1 Tax=Niallia circulans TaxID=1397 RepID=UPI001560D61A|nr:LXG domain-containing protein [Niallia circulans]NRG29381.1 LXG domain-containing protein [Niallia circulans]
MKVLEVASLEEYLDQTIKSFKEKVEQIHSLEQSVMELVDLDGSFHGKGAESIKFFYESSHKPFLVKLKQVIQDYQKKISKCREAINSFEPNEDGFIRQSFLQEELSDRLTSVQNYTNDVIADGNSVMEKISDIISLASLDDSMFNSEIKNAKNKIAETINQLETIDRQNADSFNEIKSDLAIMQSYLSELNTNVNLNPELIRHFSPYNLLTSTSHFLLVSSIKPSNSGFDSNPPYRNDSPKSIFLLDAYGQYPYRWLGLNYTPSSEKQEVDKEINEDGFLVGDKVTKGDFSAEGGLGKIENDWSGFDDFKNGSGQLGGASSFRGIHAGLEYDTAILDSSFSQDILFAEGQASVGGSSILPIAKAGGSVYTAQVKSQIDKEVDFVGSTGLEAKGEILKANAFAGVDGSSVGFGAKASVAEGEVSGIAPIPFTDYTIKGTVGASAVGIGGEAKVGKEIVLDLRLLLGVKIGISFEKEE